MTDPKQKAAEESFHSTKIRNAAVETPKEKYIRVFSMGWDAALKSLLEAGVDFNYNEIEEKSRWYHKDCYVGTQEDIFIEGARYQHQLSQPREAALREQVKELQLIISGKTFDDENMRLKAEVEKWKDEADLWREQSAKWKAEVDKFTNSFAEISTLASCMISSRQLGEGRSALEELNEIIKREIDKLGLPGYRGR